MQSYDVYKDIMNRTGGDIYIGVVGPVRTGKSTFITRLVTQMLLPMIEDENERRRIVDELPQSGAGRTIMTTQPKFVPSEAAELKLGENAALKLRLVDCVGYMVDGALGHEEDGMPRMVQTPWSTEEIPFEQAAEIGTRKVIEEHSTVGIVMTTDGSIQELPRAAYVPAEQRAIQELQRLGKPFIVVLNTATPQSEETSRLAEQISSQYGCTVRIMNVLTFGEGDMVSLLTDLLMQFPIREIDIDLAGWVCQLPPAHWLMKSVAEKIEEGSSQMMLMAHSDRMRQVFAGEDYVRRAEVSSVDLGSGVITVSIEMQESLFYTVLGEECGYEIKDDSHLISVIKELVAAKKQYDRIESALSDVERTGYGVVPPELPQLVLQSPELLKENGRFGVRLKAAAPSLHIVKVDVQTEVNPIVGTEKQTEDLITHITSEIETDPEQIWNTDIFGKSLYDLVREGLNSKLSNETEDAQLKLREMMGRIVNEGDGGMVCILL